MSKKEKETRKLYTSKRNANQQISAESFGFV